MVKHIVFIKLKDENKQENALKIKELLEELPSKIDGLLDMEVGINFDEADRAMDLSLYSSFDSKEDLNIYATHKDHLKVIDFIKTCADYTKVVDYIV
jgi:hypothetical protein